MSSGDTSRGTHRSPRGPDPPRRICGTVSGSSTPRSRTIGPSTWRKTNDTGWPRGGGHGEQVRHPVILGKTIYAEAHAYDLATGKPLEDWEFDHERGACGTVTASASCLFFRDGNPTMLELASHRQTNLSRVSRTGCWVNIIPAGGLVVVPEGSAGCTCAYPIQTSMAFVPKDSALPST